MQKPENPTLRRYKIVSELDLLHHVLLLIICAMFYVFIFITLQTRRGVDNLYNRMGLCDEIKTYNNCEFGERYLKREPKPTKKKVQKKRGRKILKKRKRKNQ